MTDAVAKCCSGCQKIYPATSEYFQLDKNGSGRIGLRSKCKVCRNAAEKQRKKMKSLQNAPKQRTRGQILGTPDLCGACGVTTGNIIGDVDKATFKTYGYLCMKCHRLVQDFQGEAERMRKALTYIEQTRLDKKSR